MQDPTPVIFRAPIRGVLAYAAAAFLVFALPAQAVTLIADFNDVTTGNVSGKLGGTGWTSNWSGSANPMVVGGDLSSSRYSLGQSAGTAQHISGTNLTGLRQNFRSTPTLTGEIWFSYLALTSASTTGAGLSFNPGTASPFDNTGNAFLQFLGTNLVYRFGETMDVTIPGVISLNSTALVVGQMILNGSGAADSIKIWVNPDLVNTPSIFDHTPLISSSALHFADSVSVIGAITHNAGGVTGNAGHLDAIRISDGGGNQEQAILAVAGVIPEPTAVLLALSGLVVLSTRRRRAILR